ncbi:MAG TPA: FimB/Mfa2 family fimbrial subunit [Candidatus Coprenecus stercoravium]|uniref:FimB/Mfa2 family fimbrial subunit n=1 Tax=Candidatus Coprenecus stercoravium TaxID=2840735 RepID=A0A9D2GQ86_9BACT|nr:FimB/Mfa2 family fimbrial subunit [Candidatus Coprenecus stercoravium]
MRPALKIFLPLLTSVLLQGCLVHEWPDAPETRDIHLILSYDTDMDTSEHSFGTRSQSVITDNDIRYIIRAFPKVKGSKASMEPACEFVFSSDAGNGYDNEFSISVPPGDYDILVWTDMVNDNSTEDLHYSTADFNSISLNGDIHPANTDSRDAFRGTGGISVSSDIMDKAPDTLRIEMERPLAKYEFIADDLAEFIDRQTAAVLEKNGEIESSPIRLSDYKVVFHYVGFMPDTYSLFTDKPVDSSTGISFESSITKISESEASMGFDYVFINSQSSTVTVQIGIYGPDGGRIGMTEQIEVPLNRSSHTVMRGGFLLSNASGGISVNPEFDGDHNLIL